MLYAESKSLIWLDLEMTGMDLEKDRILQIATVATSNDLSELIKGPDLVIKQSNQMLDNMGDWCRINHGKSGLTDQSRASTINEKQAEQQTIEFLEMVVDKGTSPMCGRTLFLDRLFLKKWMPELYDWFHFRSIDVSSISELYARWNQTYFQQARNDKKSSHLAMDDILDAIDELKFYKQYMV